MDYKKIYTEFIASRRQREPELISSSKYFERHHIVPRSLGGDDSSTNMIALTAQDHLFSHLLLAKIHGGLMWLAVKAMLDFEPNMEKKSRKITSKTLREKYNYVRTNVAKNYSERFSGQSHPTADQNTYVLKNIDGRSVEGNRTELIQATGMSRSSIGSLLLGSKNSYNGWYFPVKNPQGRYGPLKGIESPQADKALYKFYHVSGKYFEGTQTDFKELTGLAPSPLINGTNKSTKDGWGINKKDCGNWLIGKMHRAQNAANSRGDICGINNPRAIQKIYRFFNVETKEERECMRAEMANYLKVNSAQMQGMLSGHYRIQNWCLKEFIDKGSDIGGWKQRGKSVTIQKNNEIFTGTRKECAAFLKVAPQTISAFVLGRYKTCKGWTLVAETQN